MRFSDRNDLNLNPVIVRHQGNVIALAMDTLGHTYYRVLNLTPAQPDDDKSWLSPRKLAFPEQIRPAGMSLVTVDRQSFTRQELPDAAAQFQAISDGQHVYVFRQSAVGTLYVDRFVFDAATKELRPTYETRFQRSRKRDLPAGRKDTVGPRDMLRSPFFEPTLELNLDAMITDGCFSVLLIPTSLPDTWRWQIFAIVGGELEAYSIARSVDGLFDLSDLRHTTYHMKTNSALTTQFGPSALLYTRQEESGGQRLKRESRMMVGLTLTEQPSNPMIGMLDFAISRDGTLAPIAGERGHDEHVAVHMTMLALPAGSSIASLPLVSDPSTAIQGLDVRGALIESTPAKSAPFLLESADGLIHMYFRAQDDSWAVLQFETLTARAIYTSAGLRFIAARPGSHMNDCLIRLTDGTDADTCTLTFSSANDTSETWPNLPRRLDHFVAVLNGAAVSDPNDPAVLSGARPLYDYAAVVRTGDTTLPANADPPAGSLLFSVALVGFADDAADHTAGNLVIGHNSYTIPLGANNGQLRFTTLRPGDWDDYTITISESGALGGYMLKIKGANGIAETWDGLPDTLNQFMAVLNGTPTSITYNYTQRIQRAGFPPPEQGIELPQRSWLFSVSAENGSSGTATTVIVGSSGAATPVADIDTSGRDCGWIAEPPTTALQFQSDTYSVELKNQAVIAGDLTLEAWVNHTKDQGVGDPIFHYSQPNGANFRLGASSEWSDSGIDTRRIYATTRQYPNERSTANISRDNVLTAGQWTHVAAVYNASTALKLDGVGYVDCGNAAALDSFDALSVEALATCDANAGTGVIAARWGATPHEQLWKLELVDFKPRFSAYDAENNQILVVTDDANQLQLQTGQLYHVAATFDSAAREEVALELDGNSWTYIDKKPGEAIYDFNRDFSVEYWFKAAADQKANEAFILEKGDNTLERPFSFRYNGITGQIKMVRQDANGNPIEITSHALNDGQWHHIALVRTTDVSNTSKLFLYVDGMLENPTGADDHARLMIDDQPIYIGKRGASPNDTIDTPTTRFAGQIRDIRIWSRPLQIEDIRANMHSEHVVGPIARWKLDMLDRTTGRINDSIGDWHSVPKTDIYNLGKWKFVDVDMCSYELRLYVDGVIVGRQPLSGQPKASALPSGRPRLTIGRETPDGGRALKGALDEVRIWKAARERWQLVAYSDRALPADAEGLLACWRFEEGRGNVAFDSKGTNHGRLVHVDEPSIAAMWVPSARNARWQIYINGQEVAVDTNILEIHGVSINEYGPEQLRIGGASLINTSGTAMTHYFGGMLDDLRIWNAARTPEQIADNMYRPLLGYEDALIGYWRCDEGSGTRLNDLSGHGRTGTLGIDTRFNLGVTWAKSDAPIGNEAPEVRNLAGNARAGVRKIAGPPAAIEYGDMQYDADGNMAGVMKRCYIAADATNGITMYTGFKVGDLEMQYIGQVQTDPTLIGYIEGAPPVPSENLTVNDPSEDDYAGISAIMLIEATESVQLYSASRERSSGYGIDMTAGLMVATDASMDAIPAVSMTIAQLDARVGVHATFEQSTGWLSSAAVTNGASRTMTKSLSLTGQWEARQLYGGSTPRYLNPAVGRRYMPSNVGYALVKSGTADLFALRLRQTGALVAYQMLPNPDIPEDWNIIMFPIDPAYIKNGTLDGMVGGVADPQFPGASSGERGSYFKPLEAYALKERIERENKRISATYDSYNAGDKGRSPASGDSGPSGWDNSSGDSARQLDTLPENTLNVAWGGNTATPRRSIVNTYVWTASGGLYAEEEQFSSVREESLGGSYSFTTQAGVHASMEAVAYGAGAFFELDALFGGNLSITHAKTKQDSASFGMSVQLECEGFLNRWDGDPDRQAGEYSSQLCPGKVDAYRFMTFYLAPDTEYFDRFFDEVVDKTWLNGPGYNPNARALAEARGRPNQVWRVMHRVTYVSRVPEQFRETANESIAPDQRAPIHLDSNAALIQQLRQQAVIHDSTSKLADLGDTINTLLGSSASDLGQVAKTYGWWRDVVDMARQEIRQDVLSYLKGDPDLVLVPPPIMIGQAPKVTATAIAQIGQYGTVELAATIDDGRTDQRQPPAIMLWAKRRGPGTVKFADTSALHTTATFSAPGMYELRFTADNGYAVANAIVTIEVLAERPKRTDSDLLALYTFKANGNKALVSDTVGSLHLTINEPDKTVKWLANSGLAVTAATTIRSGAAAKSISGPITQSNTFSIEAWIKPASVSTGHRAAHIVSLSKDYDHCNVTLQQGERYMSAFDFCRVRLRSSDTNDRGMPKATDDSVEPITTPKGSLTERLTHIVYTRDNTGSAYIYVDGVQQSAAPLNGRFTNWDADCSLTLANDGGKNDYPWLGEYHLVAIYKRALTPGEVRWNFEAGVS